MPSVQRAGIWTSVALVSVIALCSGAGHAHANRLDALERASHDPSWRVRLQAAYVLSRQNNVAVAPILEGLLTDEQDAVRGVAAAALGELGPLNATDYDRVRTALDAATRDRASLVRDRAKIALGKLQRVETLPRMGATGGGVHVSIGGIGAKPKHISPELTRRLRELLVREFSKTPGITLDGQPITGFLIDSSIIAMTRRNTRDWVEINCEISVIVGRLPSKAIVMMTSGGATLQEPKLDLSPEKTASLEAEALEGAVKGAHENLLAYLRQQR